MTWIISTISIYCRKKDAYFTDKNQSEDRSTGIYECESGGNYLFTSDKNIFGVVDLYNDAYCETTDRFNSFISVGYGNSYHGCFDSADVSWNFGVVEFYDAIIYLIIMIFIIII